MVMKLKLDKKLQRRTKKIKGTLTVYEQAVVDNVLIKDITIEMCKQLKLAIVQSEKYPRQYVLRELGLTQLSYTELKNVKMRPIFEQALFLQKLTKLKETEQYIMANGVGPMPLERDIYEVSKLTISDKRNLHASALLGIYPIAVLREMSGYKGSVSVMRNRAKGRLSTEMFDAAVIKYRQEIINRTKMLLKMDNRPKRDYFIYEYTPESFDYRQCRMSPIDALIVEVVVASNKFTTKEIVAWSGLTYNGITSIRHRLKKRGGLNARNEDVG